jgi:hypothetical protein
MTSSLPHRHRLCMPRYSVTALPQRRYARWFVAPPEDPFRPAQSQDRDPFLSSDSTSCITRSAFYEELGYSCRRIRYRSRFYSIIARSSNCSW